MKTTETTTTNTETTSTTSTTTDTTTTTARQRRQARRWEALAHHRWPRPEVSWRARKRLREALERHPGRVVAEAIASAVAERAYRAWLVVRSEAYGGH